MREGECYEYCRGRRVRSKVGFLCSGCMDCGACIDTHVAKIYIDAALSCINVWDSIFLLPTR